MGDFVPISGRRIVAQTRSRSGIRYSRIFSSATGQPFFLNLSHRNSPGLTRRYVILLHSMSFFKFFTSLITFVVPHSSEIPFIFGTLTNVSSQALALSAMMQDYWISFATNLDSNDSYGSKREIELTVPRTPSPLLNTLCLYQVRFGRSTPRLIRSVSDFVIVALKSYRSVVKGPHPARRFGHNHDS